MERCFSRLELFCATPYDPASSEQLVWVVVGVSMPETAVYTIPDSGTQV